MDESLRVLFIVGKGRSGSTILGDVLGSFDGVFHAGELWRLWTGGLAESFSCSCGSPVRECAVWGPILDEFSEHEAGAWALDHEDEFLDLQRRVFTFGGLTRRPFIPRRRRHLNDQYRAIMGTLYRSIAAVTGAHIIVDGSKWPIDPSLLNPPEGIVTRGVHLVRAPCDVAVSWKKQKYFPDTGDPMPQFSSLHTVASWSARNIAAEWTHHKIGDRMMVLRYEDFSRSPRRKVADVLAHGEAHVDLDDVFIGESTVTLGSRHTIMGNPSRFLKGPVTISSSPSGGRTDRTVRYLTYPLRRRYGYTHRA